MLHSLTNLCPPPLLCNVSVFVLISLLCSNRVLLTTSVGLKVDILWWISVILTYP